MGIAEVQTGGQFLSFFLLKIQKTIAATKLVKADLKIRIGLRSFLFYKAYRIIIFIIYVINRLALALVQLKVVQTRLAMDTTATRSLLSYQIYLSQGSIGDFEYKKNSSLLA